MSTPFHCPVCGKVTRRGGPKVVHCRKHVAEGRMKEIRWYHSASGKTEFVIIAPPAQQV